MSDKMMPQERTRVWWVWKMDDRRGHMFAGDLRAVIDHIDDLNIRTRIQHATIEMGAD